MREQISTKKKGGKRTMETMESDLLTPTEAAKVLRVSPATLPRWRWAGDGPDFVRIGRSIRYRREDLEKFVRRGVVRMDRGKN